jgi:glycosyltransferase involved in cell wall biosynthesis
MKMRIGIDACTWANRRGYGRFTRQLVMSMVAEHPQHTFVLVVDRHTASESKFPEGAQIEIVQTQKQPTQAASADGCRSPADLWKLSRTVSRLCFDAFFFPTRYSFYPLFCETPTVVAFHDATGERHPKLIFPGWRSRLFWYLKTRWALHRADQLVTVSEDARAQLAAVFHLSESAIEVITEGPDPCFRPIDAKPLAAPVFGKYSIPAGLPLILYVGGISPHKNLQGLLHALSRVERLPWHVVLVGDYAKDSFWGCHAEVVELAHTLGLSHRVTFTGYVPDEELLVLYNLATMLVLPSMSEGFGLPVVEAMACGLPVAVSNRNSLPEIVGNGGLLFDPLAHEQMAHAIARLLSDERLREDVRAKGLVRAKRFSWKTASRKLVRIIEEAAAHGQ